MAEVLGQMPTYVSHLCCVVLGEGSKKMKSKAHMNEGEEDEKIDDRGAELDFHEIKAGRMDSNKWTDRIRELKDITALSDQDRASCSGAMECQKTATV